jgi:hypothetical protein
MGIFDRFLGQSQPMVMPQVPQGKSPEQFPQGMRMTARELFERGELEGALAAVERELGWGKSVEALESYWDLY